MTTLGMTLNLIRPSFENNEPRLLLVVIHIQEDVPVVFDRYEKEYGTRYREFEFDNKLQEK